MAKNHFLAFDLGAESGRGILFTLDEGKLTMEELHRWPNRPAILSGTRYWDLPFLFNQMIDTLSLCARRELELTSIGVDTWGVDFGLLDGNGQLLGLPVQYRDARTEGIHEYTDPILSRDRIFELTGYEPWPLASLFQLASLKRDNSPILPAAKTFLNIPDLFNYLLTGRAFNDKSIATLSNVMDIRTEWAEEIIEAFGLNREMFGELIEPGTIIGELSEFVQQQTGLGAVPVVAACGHDTSAALAAVPAEGSDWAFISCGSWSILGTRIDAPVNTPDCLKMGFTNEYTLGGWYIARNISGLWLIQELRRKWDTPENPWDYNRITATADTDESRTYSAVFDVADDSLLAPADMEEAITKLIVAAGQEPPQTKGQLLWCVMENLALEYAWAMAAMGQLTGQVEKNLYIVGGGIANKLLMQLSANATGLPVFAGADQCTAMGNAVTQALAMGKIASIGDIPQVVINSVEINTYQPQNPDVWAAKRSDYNSKFKNQK